MKNLLKKNSIIFALHTDSNKIVHVDEVRRGNSCNCICCECGRELKATHGEKQSHHFKHKSECACAGAQESALHKLGKQILIESNEITLPKFGNIKYTILYKKRLLELLGLMFLPN